MGESRFRQAAGWGVVAAALAILAINMGSRSVFGLFLSPLNSATGLGVATISLAVAVSRLSWGAAQPLCGMLAERYGAARVIVAGSVLGAAAGALVPFADSPAALVAVLAVIGVAATVGSPSFLIGTVSQRVAPAHRGMVAGVVGAGGPLGQFALAPLTQATIAAAGWVSAALSLAALSLVALPLSLAFRGRPVTNNRRPTVPMREVLASPWYWALNATFFVCGLHVFFLMTHLPGVIELCGLPGAVSGAALAVLGLFNIAGSVAAGLALQRFSMPLMLAALYASRALGIALFIAAPKTELTVLAFSAWMGLTYMAVLPPTAGLIGRRYGVERLPTLLGITFFVHQVGAFLGAWLGGVLLESTGSYDAMWTIDLALAAAAALVSLALLPRRAGGQAKRDPSRESDDAAMGKRYVAAPR
jgi:predicted MFS family arabinose efflux permease